MEGRLLLSKNVFRHAAKENNVYEFVHVCIGVKDEQKDFPLRGVEPRPPR